MLARLKLLRKPCTNSTKKASGKIGREDFLRQRSFLIWPKEDPKVRGFRNFRAFWVKDNIPNTPNLPNNPEEAANFLLTLCQMETFLLKKQIDSLKEKFIKEGGFSENLLKKRLEYRKR